MMSHDKQNTDWRRARSQAIADAVCQAIPPQLAVMDFGSGAGHIGLLLADYCASVLFVDSDPAVATALAEQVADRPTLSVRQLDLTTQPSPHRVDCIVASMSLHHVRDIDALLDAFWATIRPGGWLFVCDLLPDAGRFHAAKPDFDGHNGFDPGALAHRLEAHGFTQATTTVPLWTGQRWAGEDLIEYSLFGLVARRPA